MDILKVLFAVTCGLSAIAVNKPLYAVEKMPIEAFAALPDFSAAKLSPSGEAIAYAVSHNGRKHIIHQNLDGTNAGLIPPSADGEIRSFNWANDDTLLIVNSTLWRRAEFVQEIQQSRLFSYNIKSKKYIWLGEPKRKKRISKSKGSLQRMSQYETIIDYLYRDPDHILMALDFDLDANPDVFKVNVRNGKRKMVRGEYRGIQNWYTDQNSDVRAGFGYDGDRWFGMIADGDGNWSNLKQMAWTKEYEFRGFSKDPNVVYVSGNSHFGTNAIYTLDIQTGEILEEVFAHSEVDVLGVITHPVTGHMVGVSYSDDFYRAKYFDKELAAMQRSIDRVLKGSVNTVVGRAKEKKLYLFYVTNSQNPGDYYLFDKAKKELSYIAPLRNHIDIERTAATNRVTIPVRGGGEIPGYLTVPFGKKVENLPAVILPHGGPHVGHDTAEWDYMAQFFANRGYLVLKPNFRGTKGYGDAFYAKGVHQWGGLMQDDVTDATHWLIDKGMADPERICIIGGSYGGYAALMGTVKEPDLYKCAISINGVPNIPAMKTDDKEIVGGRAWIKTMGLKGQKDTTVSPYHRAAEIKTPILLIVAKDDARVPYRFSKSMHAQLQKHNKISVYVETEDGGHSLVTETARFQMLTATEKFLARHIGN